MKVVVFTHSLVSDWNHGNAHFLRGVAAELLDRGHELRILEPRNGWSRANLRRERPDAELDFRRTFPRLDSEVYELSGLDLSEATDGAGLVLVHEWNDPDLIRRLGALRERGGAFRLLFHDTHHRAVTAPHEAERRDLSGYDGVLAYGRVLRDLYLERGWARRAWTWHEAADTRVFQPSPGERRRSIVWVGNWGDGERTHELREYLLEPAARLGVAGEVFGVRYPRGGRQAVARSGLAYRGWVANHRVPEVFARHAVTVHVPRRPYAEALPGIPTIRPFEALACGIPLVSAPWEDSEGLFRAGEDYLAARDGRELRRHLQAVLEDAELARSLAAKGLQTIHERHTCAHRVDELLTIVAELGVEERQAA